MSAGCQLLALYEDPTQEKWLPNVAATQEFLKTLVS